MHGARKHGLLWLISSIQGFLAFTVGQVKQKEQDLKKDFRAVKDLQEESGFCWDSNRMMVTAPESVWMGLAERRNKDSLL